MMNKSIIIKIIVVNCI